MIKICTLPVASVSSPVLDYRLYASREIKQIYRILRGAKKKKKKKKREQSN